MASRSARPAIARAMAPRGVHAGVPLFRCRPGAAPRLRARRVRSRRAPARGNARRRAGTRRARAARRFRRSETSARLSSSALDDFARALRREAPVGGERHHQKARAAPARARARGRRRVRARRVEIVQRLGDQQIGVGVEVLGELVALVAQIGLDLEFRVERKLIAARRAAAAELSPSSLVRQVGDVADHARQAQAAPRHRRRARRSRRRGNPGRSRIAWRATSLKAMFCADSFGAAAMTSAWRDALRIARSPTAAPACRPGCRPSPRRNARCRAGRRGAPAPPPSPRPSPSESSRPRACRSRDRSTPGRSSRSSRRGC